MRLTDSSTDAVSNDVADSVTFMAAYCLADSGTKSGNILATIVTL